MRSAVRLHAFPHLAAIAVAIVCSAAHAADSWPGEALVAAIESVRQERGVPAVGLALVDAGTPILVRAWGLTGNDAAPEADADTLFRIGSITKTVTALAMLRLAEEGRVDLDDRLDDRAAGHLVANPWSEPVRLVHLLELSAGLPDLSREEFDSNVSLDLEAALVRAGPRRLLWPPGLVHGYTNVAPGLTAKVVETVTGQRFEDYAKRAVLLPLGMASAAFEPEPTTLDRLARGHTIRGERQIPYWHVTFRAFGGLNASTAEMARLIAMLANGGRLDGRAVFAPTSIARMLRPESTLAARAGLDVGYGKGIYTRISDGRVLWTHGGDADGFRSRFAVLPSVGRGYYVVINADDIDALNEMVGRIEHHLSTGLERPIAPKEAVLPATALSQWEGTYYPATARFGVDRWCRGEARTAEVMRHEDRLVVRPSGRKPIDLWPVSERLYRRRRDPVATVVFARDGGGSTYLLGEVGDYVRIQPGPLPTYLAGVGRCRVASPGH